MKEKNNNNQDIITDVTRNVGRHGTRETEICEIWFSVIYREYQNIEREKDIRSHYLNILIKVTETQSCRSTHEDKA